MKRVKVRVFSGCMCEQIVYHVSEKAKNVRNAKPRLRFATDEERNRHRTEISRRKHIRLVNTNFTSKSLYSTLTLDNQHEVHTFAEMRRIQDNFTRRLKRAFPNAVIFSYIGRGKTTSRIHMHMLSDGIPADVIKTQWWYGAIKEIKQMREHNTYNGIDHGQDYTGLANYLFDHWTEEIGGHRWRMTRNARQPDREEPQEIKRNYSAESSPKPPKGYILVESKCTPYGYLYYKYVKKPMGYRQRQEKDDK